MSQIATLQGSGWRAVPLVDEHAESLPGLYEDCADYFELIQGGPPGPAEVQSAFTALPEGKTHEDKFAFLIIDEVADVIGHLEVIRDYPAAGEWWIGILLPSPDSRRRGLGTYVHRSCAEWARAHGAKALLLSVVEDNIDALRFWERLGYEELEPFLSRSQQPIDRCSENLDRLVCPWMRWVSCAHTGAPAWEQHS